MRDITLGETHDFKFTTTEPDTGAPATLSGTPVVSAYVGNSTTQITAGITLSVDFDGVTGLNNVRVVATSGNGFADGTDVALVITTGTVDGNSAVGYVIESFTIGRGAAHTRLGAPAGASVSADIATVDSNVDAILVDTGTTLDGKLNTIDTNIDSILADTGTDGVAISSSTLNSIADAVWDEATSGHVTAGSFGATNPIIRSNTAQSATGTTIVLDASASGTDDFYNNCFIYILSGTGAGQGRFITDYVGSTKTATVDTWVTNPSSDSVFVITPFGTLPGASAPTASEVADAVWDEALSGHTTSGTAGEALGGTILRTGTAQAGGASTITLDASASATNDLYNYGIIRIIGGTGAGQSRQISDYVGSSKVATVSLAWTVQPSSDSVFQIIALGVDAATIAAIADGVWDEARSGHVTAGTFGERVQANVTQISGDTTAADNAESFFDGTGYAGTNNVIPSVTNVTGGINTGAGTITTLDALDTAQDTQHASTRTVLGTPTDTDIATDIANVGASIATAQGDITDILEDTGTTIPAQIGTPVNADISADIAAVKTQTAAIETDTQDIQSRLPAALVSGRMASDAAAISGSTTAADRLEANMLGVVTGQAATGTLSTTQMTTNVSEATDDHFIGRIITFTSGALAGQSTDITDYTGSGGLFTFTELTDTPSNGDTFVIT